MLAAASATGSGCGSGSGLATASATVLAPESGLESEVGSGSGLATVSAPGSGLESEMDSGSAWVTVSVTGSATGSGCESGCRAVSRARWWVRGCLAEWVPSTRDVDGDAVELVVGIAEVLTVGNVVGKESAGVVGPVCDSPFLGWLAGCSFGFVCRLGVDRSSFAFCPSCVSFGEDECLCRQLLLEVATQLSSQLHQNAAHLTVPVSTCVQAPPPVSATFVEVHTFTAR